MRKWLYLLLGLALLYSLTKVDHRKKKKSAFFKRFNETLSILVWVLLSVYTLTFLYWLYTQIF